MLEKVIKDIFLKLIFNILKKMHELHSDLLVLPERMKIEKVEKLGNNLHDKTEYVIHTRSLKQALIHELVLRKVHRVIKFNQKAWLKPNIDMNTKLGKKTKIDFEKDLFKLMNNAVFRKVMENVRKHRNIKLLTRKMIRHYLVSEPNYQTRKFSTKKLLAVELRKTQIPINKPVYLVLSI